MSNPHDRTSEDVPAGRIAHLVRQARRGDLSAFDALVEQFQRRAVAVAYRLLNNLDDAMEISQDAFLKAYTALGTLSKPAQFGPWLMRIVGNLSLNRRRARALRSAGSLEGDGGRDDRPAREPPDRRAEDPAGVASAHELKDRIAEALAELPPMQREALVLFSMGQIPQKEVARMLGCSVEAVKWHVFTARRALKDVLKDYL